jgi:geranylgeranyl diphosphate synthase type II
MPVSADLEERLAAWRRRVEDSLDRALPPPEEQPPDLHRGMRYAVFPGGKRLRPLLVLAAAESVGGDIETALPGASAVELVHAYSLVHDDLPALDNDELRRGRPTVHRAFGEALAILIGDALLTRAFGVLASAAGDPRRRLEAAAVLAEAAGCSGMIGGQVDDLQSEGRSPDAAAVESIHRRKTAALMGACARIGALLGGGDPAQVRALGVFGERIGLAFQIVDDLLDCEGSEREMGKAARKDAAAGKLTFPAVWGVEASRQRARDLAREAGEALPGWGPRARALEHIAGYVISRTR